MDYKETVLKCLQYWSADYGSDSNTDSYVNFSFREQ